jgi:predicted NAD/FAD-binding protein
MVKGLWELRGGKRGGGAAPDGWLECPVISVKKIAIIGSGIAGLGTAYWLRDRADLTVYEKNDYFGGHTNTVRVEDQGQARAIDTGFMVYNEVTYPNLTRFFRELGVETCATNMSFSVRHGPSDLEYNGSSVSHLFAQRRNLWRPRFWRMLARIHRFNSEAVEALGDPRSAGMTLEAFVRDRGYGEDFLNLYLIPMAGAVWSTPPGKMLDFPAATLLRFWHNHGFLGLHTQHPWRTVVNGAQSYVLKLRALLGDRLRSGCPVLGVRRSGLGTGAEVCEADGVWRFYDKVVLACHADQSLRLLQDPTPEEVRLLSRFRYQANPTLLHTDASVMPRTRRAWASWNYRIERGADGALSHTTHYWMNSLQPIGSRPSYFVSLNDGGRVEPSRILRRIDYEHPLFDLEAIRAQGELAGLNSMHSEQSTYYCGAWFKYGFHEDGLRSGLDCARAIAGGEVWS